MTLARVPANLITGFLGAGKTTAILSLLAAREDYREQIRLADVLVINRRDLATPEELAMTRRAAAGFSQPKLAIVETGHGKLDPALLDVNI